MYIHKTIEIHIGILTANGCWLDTDQIFWLDSMGLGPGKLQRETGVSAILRRGIDRCGLGLTNTMISAKDEGRSRWGMCETGVKVVRVIGWSGDRKSGGRNQNLQVKWNLVQDLISLVHRAKTRKKGDGCHLSFRYRKWKKIIMISLKTQNGAIVF